MNLKRIILLCSLIAIGLSEHTMATEPEDDQKPNPPVTTNKEAYQEGEPLITQLARECVQEGFKSAVRDVFRDAFREGLNEGLQQVAKTLAPLFNGFAPLDNLPEHISDINAAYPDRVHEVEKGFYKIGCNDVYEEPMPCPFNNGQTPCYKGVWKLNSDQSFDRVFKELEENQYHQITIISEWETRDYINKHASLNLENLRFLELKFQSLPESDQSPPESDLNKWFNGIVEAFHPYKNLSIFVGKKNEETILKHHCNDPSL